MSRRKRRDGEAAPPASSAGLFSFWGEKTDSIAKIRPELVIVMAVVLIAAVILANAFIRSI
ncbi:preprotein translocase subunit Sec61beta [Candidatus Bathyarchaeota archaeon]|nr:preprotein translocase subunit Sec61beta [Candidatus Bathyarchaeota archaeon]